MIGGAAAGLRAIETADLPQLLAWRNDPAFRRYFREHRELSLVQQERWYQTVVLDDPRTRMFAVVDRSSGQLVGAAGLCWIDWVNRTADFSLYIGLNGAYIDAVFAPDAGRALLRYGFGELALHRIWCEIYDFDTQKMTLLDELGFSREGRHRETHFTGGAWCDSLFYGIVVHDVEPAAGLGRRQAGAESQRPSS